MSEKRNKELFLSKIDACKGIINKVTTLYTDSREDREDLFQEILYQSFRSFPYFREDANFSTWLYRVALNTALVYRRNEKKHRNKNMVTEITQTTNETVYDTYEKAALLDAIRALPRVERMIILLHLEGYSNSEIADMAGISKEHTAVKIHRIKKILTQNLKEEE